MHEISLGLRLSGLVGTVAMALIALFSVSASASPVAGDPCPNEEIREQQGVDYLPDCMALEMVSPPGSRNRVVE